MEQMTAFLQSLQQAASGSSRQSDRRKLRKDFKEHDPPSFDWKPNTVAVQDLLEEDVSLFTMLATIADKLDILDATVLSYRDNSNSRPEDSIRIQPMFQQSPASSYASASQSRGPQQNFHCQQPRPQHSGFQPTQTIHIATPATSSRGSFQPQGEYRIQR